MSNVTQAGQRSLLLLAIAVLLGGVLLLSLASAGKIEYTSLAAASGVAVFWLGADIYVKRRGYSGDPLLLPLSAMLSAIGLIMILRLAPALYMMQAVWLGIGISVFLLIVSYKPRWADVAQYKYVCGFIGVLLLATAVVFGTEIGGHKSWVIIGPLRFQPAEFAKLFIVLFLAAYLNERREVMAAASVKWKGFTLPHPRFVAPLLFVWGITMVILVLQRDMGSALLYFGITLLMTYMASGRFSYILIGLLFFAAGSVLCYFLYAHIQTRVDIWLNPWADPNGRAYQIVQSLFAFGSGGILGSGLTHGFPSLIPEVHTDFIFAAIGEEWGFAGSAAVLMCYLLLIYRAFRIALLQREAFMALLAGGLAVVLCLQTFLIIAGVTKFFPLTGIPLPLISYGGSAAVSNFILLAILFNLSETGSHSL